MTKTRLVNSITILLLVLIPFLIALSPLRVNHDVGHLLVIARMIVEGHLPYAEIHDINMPITHYLHLIPIMLGRVMHLNPIPIFLLLVFALTLWCIVTLFRLSRKFPDALLPSIAATINLAIALITIGVYLTNGYGQRDHLFIVFYLPGFILRWLRWDGHEIPRSTAIMVGIMAAVGAWIKPYFLIIIVLVEAYWLLKHRNLRSVLTPELAAFTGFTALYALHIFLLPQAVRTGFIEWFSFVNEIGYKAYGYFQPLDLILRSPVLLAIGLGALIVPGKRSPTRTLLQSFGVLTLAAVIERGIQQRGYDYHLIPAIMAGVITVAVFHVVTIGQMSAASRNQRRIALALEGALLGTVLAVGILGVTVLREGIRTSLFMPPDPELTQVMREYSRENDAILFVTSDLNPYRLLVQENRTSATGELPALAVVFSYYEMPEAEYDNNPPPPAVARYLDGLRDDIRRKHPPLIYVLDVVGCTACPDYFSFHDFLKRNELLQQEIWLVYENLGRFGNYVVYHYVGDAQHVTP